MTTIFSDNFSELQNCCYPLYPVYGVTPFPWVRELIQNTHSTEISSNNWNINFTSSPPVNYYAFTSGYFNNYEEPSSPSSVDLSNVTQIKIKIESIEDVFNADVQISLDISSEISDYPWHTSVYNITQKGIITFDINPPPSWREPNISIISYIQVYVEFKQKDPNGLFGGKMKLNSLTAVVPGCPFFDNFFTVQNGNEILNSPGGILPINCTRSVIGGDIFSNKLNITANELSVCTLKYEFPEHIDLTCVSDIRFNIELLELTNCLLSITYSIKNTSNQTSTETSTIVTSSLFIQQPLIKHNIKEIVFTFDIIPINPNEPLSANIKCGEITSTYGSESPIEVSVTNPYKCNNGIIKVISENTLPPYQLTCPDGQIITNNTGVFYIVNGGTYQLLSLGGTTISCCDSSIPKIIKVPMNLNLWCI